MPSCLAMVDDMAREQPFCSDRDMQINVIAISEVSRDGFYLHGRASALTLIGDLVGLYPMAVDPTPCCLFLTTNGSSPPFPSHQVV